MQTVLSECEAILNNRPLTYIYPTDLTSYLATNHLFYGRIIQSPFIQAPPLTHAPSELTNNSNQVTTVINRFGNKWRYEYLVNLREAHRYYCTNKNQPSIPLNDAVLVHSDKTPRSVCDAVISDLFISGYQYVIWYQSLFGICIVVERMLMHTNALFYLSVVFIRLHELTWHLNGSIKCQTF